MLSISVAHWLVGSVRQWPGSHTKDSKKKKKWYLIPPSLTFSIIRYISNVKWSNPGKGVTPSLGVVANKKGAFGSPTLFYFYINLL